MSDDLRLERLSISNDRDVSFMYETRRDPRVSVFLLGEPPGSLEEHISWVEKVTLSRKRLLFVVKLGDTNIGYCQAYNITDTEAEVGFVIHPDHQGKKYGTQVVNLLVETLKKTFETIGKKICLHVKQGNDRAAHVYEKCGFVKTGVMRNDSQRYELR